MPDSTGSRSPEALQRILRAFLAIGDRYVVLFREYIRPQRQEFQRLVVAPVQAVFQRGVGDGVLRDDIAVSMLVRLFTGLVGGAVGAEMPRTLGIEQTAASLASLFLDGALRQA